MNTLVSSSNSIENNKSYDLEKLLIYKMKRMGPSMDPWGTPCLIYLFIRMAIVVLNKLFLERQIINIAYNNKTITL